MAISLEEIVKSEKDKLLDSKYKSVRQALRLNVSKFVSESPNGNLEKYIGTFLGYNIDNDSNSQPQQEPSILDSLLSVGIIMDKVVASVGDATDSRLAYLLTNQCIIQLDELTSYTRSIRLNVFPNYKEKYSFGMTEEAEVKALVIKGVFRSVKAMLDKYYYSFRAISINKTAKPIFSKVSIFRDKLNNFEYFVMTITNKVDKEDRIHITKFTKELKAVMLNLRKLIEAVDASNFGKLANTIIDLARESGFRMFAKYNNDIELKRPESRKGVVVHLKDLVDSYDKILLPIKKSLSEIDSTRRFVLSRRTDNSIDKRQVYWDIYQIIEKFRDSMSEINDTLGRIFSTYNPDYKYFSLTVKSVILPYSMQAKGGINETFIVELKNLDIFFWKLIVTLIELSEDDYATIDEILGLSVNVSKQDFERYIHNSKGNEISEDIILEELDSNKEQGA